MPVQLMLAMLRNPASTGSLLPSSRQLANSMAAAASGSDLVIELGAGTGSVTRALLERVSPAALITVEIQPALARTLRSRFPAIDVRQASALQVLDALADVPGKVTVISSLPFRSLPRQVAMETVDSLCRFLAKTPSRKLVQFTYQPRAPFNAPGSLRWTRTAIVWKNTPPAGVWELQTVQVHEPAECSLSVSA
ncbi:class I SAM-dependent methyltransferase [Rhodocyclaceae bacterium SMB388]